MEREIITLGRCLRTIVYFILGIDGNTIDTEYEIVRKAVPAHKVRRHRLPYTSDMIVHYIHSYKSPIIKKSIWRMKFNNDKKYIELFGKQLGIHIAKEIHNAKGIDNRTRKQICKFLIVPVPTTPQRLRTRGLWTTYEITRYAQKYISESHIDIKSIRRKESPKQSHHSHAKERIAAMQDIFYMQSAQTKIFANKHIICIDDVSTTGATLADIRRVCQNAGCASFTAWVIAD